MKFTKTKIAALMLVVILAFTGCMSEQVDIVINSDGSGSMEAMVSVDKQALVDSINSVAAETGQKMGEAELKEFEAEMLKGGYKLVTIDGKEYYQMSKKQTIKKGELQKTFSDETMTTYVTTDTVYFEISMSDNEEIKSMQESMALYGVKDTGDLMKVTFTVQMPKAIVSTNGTIDKANPNKASFNVSIDKSSTVFATTKSGVTASTVKATIKKLNAINAPKIKKIKANKVAAKAKKATVTLKFKKIKAAKKYQIEYSTKKTFKNATAKTTKKTTYTIKKLKKNTKYYVRVRAVKDNYAGVEVYSKWAKKSVKTKK